MFYLLWTTKFLRRSFIIETDTNTSNTVCVMMPTLG
jgi:hypothetical protein